MAHPPAIRALVPERSREFSNAQLALMKRTVAKDCTEDEFDLFVEIARRVGLDPFRRQIYCIITNKSDKDRRQLVPVTGIDGFRAVAARNRDYRPDDAEPTYTYDESLKNPDTNPLGLERAVVRAFKQDSGGIWHAVVGTAYWEEFAPIIDGSKWEDSGEKKADGTVKWKKVDGVATLDPNKKNWRTMPRVMLGKCAEAQALRRGWPEDLSGVYAPEEMDRAMTQERTAAEAAAHFEEERRLAFVNAKDTVPMIFEQTVGITFTPLGSVVDRAAEHLRACTSAASVEMWRDQNRAGLQQFWATNKGEAFEVRRMIDARIAELNATP